MGTRVLDGADVVGPEGAVHVHGDDAPVQPRGAAAVGGGEGGGALLQVPGLEPAGTPSLGQ